MFNGSWDHERGPPRGLETYHEEYGVARLGASEGENDDLM